MKTDQTSLLSRIRAFTLIELLVVIAIIGILMAILTPALRSSIDKAKRARVQADVNSIANAIRAYYNEYSKLPILNADQGKADKEFKDNDAKTIIAMLTTNNPRRIIFLEVPGGATDGTYLDIWGTQYFVAMDCDYNGMIDVNGTGLGTNRVFAPGVAYSAGPDKDESRVEDNVFSFR